MKPGNTTPAKMRAIRTKVRVQQLAHGRGLPLPQYQTSGAAGVDLPAALELHETIILRPGARALVPTGLALEIPLGFEAQIRPRSGLAMRHGITVLNAPGTIDSDYRGEVKVLLINHGQDEFTITRGERIAQMVLAQVCQANLVNVVSLCDSERGSGGFGSTGTAASAIKSIGTAKAAGKAAASIRKTAGSGGKKTAPETARKSKSTRAKTKPAGTAKKRKPAQSKRRVAKPAKLSLAAKRESTTSSPPRKRKTVKKKVANRKGPPRK